jgi:hypothetical protein
MTRCRTELIATLEAQDNDEATVPLPEWASSLHVYNPLAAPILIRWTNVGGPPGVAAGQEQPELGVPGEAVLTWPIPSEATHLRARVDFAGAVPAGDVGHAARLYVSELGVGASTGLLNV